MCTPHSCSTSGFPRITACAACASIQSRIHGRAVLLQLSGHLHIGQRVSPHTIDAYHAMF